MAKYIGKRLLRSLLTLFIIITIVFSLLRLMPIEGYFENFEKLSSAQINVGLRQLGAEGPGAGTDDELLEGRHEGRLGGSATNTGWAPPYWTLSRRRSLCP